MTTALARPRPADVRRCLTGRLQAPGRRTESSMNDDANLDPYADLPLPVQPSDPDALPFDEPPPGEEV